jgi:uncharacterized protein
MKKMITILIVIFIIVFIIVFVTNSGLSLKQPKAMVQDHSFNLLLAKNDKEKQIGLSSRKSLPENQGMLFKFSKADYYSFWMKDMKFPIDIIFIKNGKIIAIYNKIQPPTVSNKSLAVYQPQEPADTVLEINAGLSEKYGFKKDMEIKYENLGS